MILTSLPDHDSPSWKLRYTSAGSYNEAHKGQQQAIRSNPFAYWYGVYRRQWRPTWERITFANVNGLQVGVVGLAG